MRSKFEFAGRCSEEFYLTVEHLPGITAPAKRYTTVSVPGRNGDLHIGDGTYQNYIQSYSCWFRDPNADPAQAAHAIKQWLLGSQGVHILRDSYDPEHFRRATFVGPMDIEQKLRGYGRCTISFDCAPQAFLESGKIKVNFENAGVLYNPTAFTALPIIIPRGGTAGTVTVNDVTVEIPIFDDYLILDCDLQNAYTIDDITGVTVNQNQHIYAPKFPVLAPGENHISFTGDVHWVEIIPRWWTI